MFRFPRVPAAATAILACVAVPAVVVAESWQVTVIGDLALTQADDVHIDFVDGRIGGHSGCNRFSGAVTLTAETPAGGRMEPGPVAATQMACLGRGAVIESAFLSALEQVTGYRIEADGTLVLQAGAAGPVRARRR